MVRASGLVHRYAEDHGRSSIEAIRCISFEIGAGEVVALIGPSGCGKSTIARILVGLLAPTQGTVEFDGAEVESQSLRCRVGYVDQCCSLLPHMTVSRNVALPLRILGRTRKSDSKVESFLKLVGMKEYAALYPYQLSGGMRQRAAIARAMVTQPELLVLDEPFAAIDELLRESLSIELLGIIGQQKTGVLLITHLIEEAVRLADRILVLTERPARIDATFERGRGSMGRDCGAQDQSLQDLLRRHLLR